MRARHAPVDTVSERRTREDLDKHCPLIELPSDVARAGLQPRAAYTQLVENMLEIFRAVYPRSGRQGNRKARVIVSMPEVASKRRLAECQSARARTLCWYPSRVAAWGVQRLDNVPRACLVPTLGRCP